MPLISVLFPAYKEDLAVFAKALSSIIDQDLIDFEVLVGFNYRSHELVDYANSLNDERIKVYVNSTNLGLFGNLNNLFDKSRGSYIARMDADDIAHSNRLSSQLRFCVSHGCDLVSSNVNFININNIDLGIYRPQKSSSKSIIWPLLFSRPLIHPTWFMKRELFSSLQGYNDVYGAEDYDFLTRAFLSGARLKNQQEILLDYRISSSSMSRTRLFEGLSNYYTLNTELFIRTIGISSPSFVAAVGTFRALLNFPSTFISIKVSKINSLLGKSLKFLLYPPSLIPKIMYLIGF
ncbi:glycosyltransferase [Synechococcus sp. CB0101]|uniref:glycosyltransferase family 2 protein n=1 Tax=Synechococcus sp. CB0101 TaxID=232348 RepID=UPI0008FEFFA0|nr:glycosyltransferase [Synechococcus sp. CB0101]QCH14421.1 glycosyltransferase [Synechococcus sp. CB0101]